MTDHEQLNKIIAECKNGDNNAFSQLVDMYATRCYGYFYRLTGNTDVSSDLLSELFVKLVTKINGFKGPSFDKWIFTIASNIFYDYLRNQYRQKKLLEAKADQLKADTTPPKTDTEMIDKLQTQLDKLDADTREVLMMRYYGKLSFKQLAKMRAEPIGTTLAKVHRALKKLKQLMENTND